MDKLKRKLYEFMQGRYGVDELNKVLWIAAIVLDILSMITNSQIAYFLFVICMVFAIYRSFSRNISARNNEKYAYERFVNLFKMKYRYRKEYNVFMCKKCKKVIRVPKGKGKIEVTCPVCGMKVVKRT